jgi:hypothetical protein
MLQSCPVLMRFFRYDVKLSNLNVHCRCDAKLSKLGVYFYEMITCATTQVSISSIMLTGDRRIAWKKSYVDVWNISVNR